MCRARGTLSLCILMLFCSTGWTGTEIQEIYESSYYNNNDGLLAVDNSTNTCFESGRERAPWLALNMAALTSVKGVFIQGLLAPMGYSVSVMTGCDRIGRSLNCRVTQHCVYQDVMPTWESHDTYVTFDCGRSLNGTHINIAAVENKIVKKLRLCDIQFMV
ncbi:uncharacterized protein LOC106151730 [Lingula anatina]|uniref:Uncharacterized protein LOC106151730 n=1 Tax=Lingula anatina TaxID=7574 RepID=A0A1S3H354_LINAN|nr:uncharacterized protein LOC106151730 [Lingula anatina]|eukprot:XP_013380565.1 uncharacterized protein LOC106151730 [Lingula anatina]